MAATTISLLSCHNINRYASRSPSSISVSTLGLTTTIALLCISLCSLLSLSSSSSFPPFQPHNKEEFQVQSSYLPNDMLEKQAERMIRSLNLFPRQAFNHHQAANVPRLVEKPFGWLDVVVFGGDRPAAGTSMKDLGHHAGYYRLPHAKDARMFYFFFESRNRKKDDPVVIWLTGGPGCSGEIALFYENGPFKIINNKNNNLSLSWNHFGWDQAANLIYVDQPIGTGFSYTSDQSDIRHDENAISNDLYDFLQAFFKEHPQYASNDFYITGESYAGHYIPAFAARVHKGNKNKEGMHVNLKGFAIGNGLTNPTVQYAAYADYALANRLINTSDHKSITRMVTPCQKSIKKCATKGDDACLSAYAICNDLFNKVLDMAGSDLNYYDIRKKCTTSSLCYDFSGMDTLLNKKLVRESLGVGDIDFVSCSSTVYSAMQNDWMKNLAVGIPTLLEDGINLLVYAGEYDLICNWLGNSRWVHEMKWSGQKDFSASPTKLFSVDGVEAGQLKSHGPLAFLKVRDAGHMVPMDQPKAALEMLRRWTQGKLATT